MAALEKIRKKAVFLTLVIGFALLAFILGDALTSSRSIFGNDRTIAKVGSTKIDVMDFQKKNEEATEQMQAQEQQTGQKTDPAVVQQQVLNQMITEVLLNDEADATGIDVTDDELSEAMIGKNANQQVVQFAQQMGMQSPAQLHDVLFNPTKFGATEEQVAKAKAQWLKMEDDMNKNMKYQKLQMLIAGALQANDLDRKAIFEENASTCHIEYVKKDYATLNDKDFPVSEAEIKAEYEKEKELFRNDQERRAVHYIAVNEDPSPSDMAKAVNVINITVKQLQAENGVDQVKNNSDLTVNSATVPASAINDPDMKAFITGAAAGAVSTPKFANHIYTIFKLNSKKMETDSVKLNMMVVQGDKKLQDSVLHALNSGMPFAQVQKIKGTKGEQGQWQVVTGIADSIKNKVLNAGADYFVLNSSAQGAYLCQVAEKKAPKEMYDVAQITYQVYPSQATIDALRGKLQRFINTNNTSKQFAAKAAAAGYQAGQAQLTVEDAQINGLQSSRKAIQWVFKDASKGSVSPIFEDKGTSDQMIVVALDDIYPEGYFSMDIPEIKQMLTQKVRNSKKGDKLMAQYKGKANSLAAYGQLMGCAVDTTNVTFGQMFIPKIGQGESQLIGRVSVAKQGALQGPFKGNNAIYVYQVVKIDRTPRRPVNDELDRQYAMTRGYGAIMRNAVEILRKATTVKNNMIKFY